MAESVQEKWATYSDGVRKAVRASVDGGHTYVSFSGRAEKEAVVLFGTPESPFDSAVYGDGNHRTYPTCYVLSDEIIEHAKSLK